jgi:hypothetical protein
MNTSNSDEKSSREAQPDTPIPEQDTIIETSTPDELEIIQETRSEHHRSGKSSKKTKSQPRHPSKEEILSRLAEKNQIIVQLNKTNFDNSKKIQELEDKYLRS